MHHHEKHHQCLIVITSPSLQASALLLQLKNRFHITTYLHSTYSYHFEHYNKSSVLVLFDMQALDKQRLIEWQRIFSRHPEKMSLLLMNVSDDYSHDDLMTWPHLRGFFNSSSDSNQLFEGLDKVLQGEYFFSVSFSNYLLNKLFASRVGAMHVTELTRREKDILLKLRDGASNTDIASHLFISENTVKTHLYNIFKKIAVKNRTQAVSWANENLGGNLL